MKKRSNKKEKRKEINQKRELNKKITKKKIIYLFNKWKNELKKHNKKESQ